MILYQLNVLTENEKTATVWSEGGFVADWQENDFSILLYQLYFLGACRRIIRACTK